MHFALASYGIIDKAFFDNDHSITPWTRPGEFSFEHARDLLPEHPQTLHPCGCNSFGIADCAGIYHASGFGEVTGPLESNPDIVPVEWSLGSIQDTAWNAWVNHGGGYIYSLCRKATFDGCRDTYSPTEDTDNYLQCVWDCFESNTLEWAPDTSQKLQYKDDTCAYATMEPQIKNGKDNHVWRFTPIPDSLQVTNGNEGRCMYESLESFSNDKAKTKFEESFGMNDVCDGGRDNHAPWQWHIMDQVQVPTNLEEGEYLLSWRWDAYMADQMWTNCADVMIVDADPEGRRLDGAEDDCPVTPSPPVDSSPTHSPSSSLSPSTTPPDGGGGDTIDCPSGYTGLLPYDECTKYYNCHDGVVRGGLTSCPDGTLFDVNFNYCNWDYLVTCEDNGSDDVQDKGCYSNNYKDCNHADFQSVENGDPASNSCTTIWLPNGKQESCVALWGECSASNLCCEPAICHDGDDSNGQCIPPTEPALDPSSTPSKVPSPMPCIECSDKKDQKMIKKNMECSTAKSYIEKKCNIHEKWISKKYCQLSCFNVGLPYDGDVCC